MRDTSFVAHVDPKSLHVSEASIGTLLPEFTTKGYCAKDFTRYFLNDQIRISKGADQLLSSLSPIRFFPSGKNQKRQLIVVAGRSMKKDPKTEEVRRFASSHGWFSSTVEDALY